MSRESTVGSIQVAVLFEALRKLGADPRTLSTRVGLTGAFQRDPAARVPSPRLLALMALAERQLNDPLVGLHAGALAETRGPLFYLILSSPRVSEGLRLMTRFASLPLESQRMQVTVREGIVDLTIELVDTALEQSCHAIDYIVGTNLGVLRQAIPGFRLLEVALTHAEVGDPGETARIFGCPVRFGQRRNVIRFPDSTLESVPAAANPAIAEQIEKFTAAMLAQMTSTSVRDRVIDAIRALLGAGQPANRLAVARRLHVSERTLQRQLEQESTAFNVLRDGVRAEISQALLSNRALKVEAVAQSVGFAEVASFSKAFTRWVGYSPTRYRDRLDRTC